MATFFDSLLSVSLIFFLLHLNLQQLNAVCQDGLSIYAYWIPVEGADDISSNGVPVQLTGPKTKSLVTANGHLIASVSEPTYLKCKEEGACFVQQIDFSGEPLLVSYTGQGNVFRILDKTAFPFGIGGWNNPLEPFVSVAGSTLSPGSKLYVKELAGVRIPGGSVHNGCVRVDDTGPAACSLRFFTGFHAYYRVLQSTLSGRVHAEEGSNCEIVNYLVPSGESTNM